MKSGDSLLIKSGTYNETFNVSTSLSGTSSKRTTIQAYGNDKVTIKGIGGNGGRVAISAANFITLKGLKITNMNQGIFVQAGSHDVILESCEVCSLGQEGIHIKENSYNVLVEKCTVRDTRTWQYNGEGIYIGSGSGFPADTSNNVTIRNCIIYNTLDEAIEFKAGTFNCIA
jgi:hypothetical protein